MARVKASVLIDARPAEVWWVLEDIAGHVDWMVDAAEIRFTSSRPFGEGTTFECDTRLGPIRLTDRMEITRWAPGKAMDVVHSGVVTGEGGFRLRRARRRRTKVTWTEELRFPWWLGGRVGAVVGGKTALAAIWRRNLRNLKAKVEGGGSGDE